MEIFKNDICVYSSEIAPLYVQKQHSQRTHQLYVQLK